jgi:hypothetical protein
VTVKQIIELVQRLRPSEYQTSDLLQWLNELEGRIFEQVIRTHIGGPEKRTVFDETNWEQTPLAGGAYEALYTNWLFAMIAYYNAEELRHNNHIVMHNELMDMFKAQYNQEHLPKPGPSITNIRGW